LATLRSKHYSKVLEYDGVLNKLRELEAHYAAYLRRLAVSIENRIAYQTGESFVSPSEFEIHEEKSHPVLRTGAIERSPSRRSSCGSSSVGTDRENLLVRIAQLEAENQILKREVNTCRTRMTSGLFVDEKETFNVSDSSDSVARAFLASLEPNSATLYKRGKDYRLSVILDTPFGPRCLAFERQEQDPKKHPDLIRNLTNVIGLALPVIRRNNRWAEEDNLLRQGVNDVLVELERHGVDPCVREDLNKIRLSVADISALDHNLNLHKRDKITNVEFVGVESPFSPAVWPWNTA